LLGPPAVTAIRAWLKARTELAGSAALGQPALFLNRGGTRLSSRSVARMLEKYLQRAGLDPRTSPHTLRHSFATHLLESGTDIRIIQALLGHRNVNTTARYAQVATSTIGGTASPLDRLRLQVTPSP